MTADIFAQLAAPFPKEAVSWRAQHFTKDGTKALALAFIDARDVMDRFDSVVGPENWQNRYPHAGAKTVCDIAVRISGEWVWKSDGAGDSDFEAEKGALSDAFKRAAVRWGVGRYLYDIAAPWVPCEAIKGAKDKWVFRSWKADPWSCVRGGPPKAAPAKPGPTTKATPGPVKVSAPSDREWYAAMRTRMHQCETLTDLNTVWQVNADGVGSLPDAGQKSLTDEYQRLASALSQAPIEGRAQ